METPELEPRRTPTSRREAVSGDVEHADGTAIASTIGNENVGRVLSSAVQRSGGSSATLDESVARAIEERRGGGSPLPEGVREDMEGAFGADFSDVRIHTDSAAHELNESVEARAFTVGNDVFFKGSAYDSTSSDGQELLAHELTHVVQQGGASGAPTTVSDPSDASEQQADAVAEQVVSGGGPAPAGADAGGVARQSMEEEDELQMSAELGRQAAEEEEELQMSADVARQGLEEEEELQT